MRTKKANAEETRWESNAPCSLPSQVCQKRLDWISDPLSAVANTHANVHKLEVAGRLHFMVGRGWQ